MSGTSPGTVEKKLGDVVSAWETLRPAKSFAGLTLAQFKTAIKPSADARVAIDGLDNQLIAAQDQRDIADVESMKKLLLVVNGVKGDPDEGEDGELYEAMGYVRKSERKSGKTNKKKASTPA